MTEITRRGFVKGAALAPLAFTGLRSMAPQTAPGDRFDFVFAGAGHNSLVCAAYLAKAGYRVLVLEGRPTIGGGTKTAEVCMPGFKEDLCSSVHSGIANNPLIRNNELQLRDYGYGEYIDPDPVMHIPFSDGASITVWRDLDRTCESIARFSKKDAETFRRMYAEYKTYTAAMAASRGASADGGAPKIPKATCGSAAWRCPLTICFAKCMRAITCAARISLPAILARFPAEIRIRARRPLVLCSR